MSGSAESSESRIDALTPRSSAAIDVARVLCIYGMVYVHVNPGSSAYDPATHGVRAFDAVRFGFIDLFGRASVPLLTLISGYLIAGSLAKGRPYGELVVSRVKGLVLPLVLWNLAYVGFVVAMDRVQAGYAEKTLGSLEPKAWPNLLLALTDYGACMPLAFLRDLFVCSLLSPVAYWAARRGSWAAAAVLVVAAAVTVAEVQTVVILRNQLLLFFFAGVVLRVRGEAMAWVPRGVWAKTALVVAVSGVGGAFAWAELHQRLPTGPADEAMQIVLFGLESLVFWWASVWLSGTRAGRPLAWVQRYVFLYFCAHLLVLTALWGAWQKVLGGYYDSAYPVFWAVSPVVALAVTIVASLGLQRVWPLGVTALNGMRPLQARKRPAGEATPVGPSDAVGAEA